MLVPEGAMPNEGKAANVPATMEDWYPDRAGEFRGKATYGKFRRFGVQISEELKKEDAN